MTFDMSKSASASRVATRALRFATGGAGRGALTGGVLGAATGAGSAVVQGEDAGTAVRRGITGAAGGAALGAVGGGTARALRDTKLLNPKLRGKQVVSETARRVGQRVRDAGRRQLHGFTGRGDPRSMGFRSTEWANEKKRLENLRYFDDLKHEGPSTRRARKHQDRMKELTEEARRGDAAINAGITSLPGTVKGLVKNPKATGKALWDETTGGSRLGAVGAVGVPLALAGPDVLRGDESATGGPSMKQKLVRLGAGVGSGILTGGLPILPAIATDTAVDALATRAVGRPKEMK